MSARTEMTKLRLSPAEQETLRYRAKRMNMNVSEYLRYSALSRGNARDEPARQGSLASDDARSAPVERLTPAIPGVSHQEPAPQNRPIEDIDPATEPVEHTFSATACDVCHEEVGHMPGCPVEGQEI